MNFYFKKYIKNLNNLYNLSHQDKLDKLYNKILKIKKNKKNKIIILGNGGSSASSSHAAVDFSKNAKVKAISFSDTSLITCLSNDYGHDKWMQKALELYVDNDDLVILLSCSGNSKNIVNAAKFCIQNKIELATLTGMSRKNNLVQTNKKGINIWINSKSYNLIEIYHLSILLYLVDRVIGKLVYAAN